MKSKCVAQEPVGWFDPKERMYKPIPIGQQSEMLSAIGDVATGDDGRLVHVVLGLRDGTTRGGHLMETTVGPTLEVTLVETAAHLRRKKHPDLGLALVDLD